MRVLTNKYADDTPLYTALFMSPQTALNKLELCFSKLQLWFLRNDLLLNPGKSEVSKFGTNQKLQHTHLPSSVCVAGRSVIINASPSGDSLCNNDVIMMM